MEYRQNNNTMLLCAVIHAVRKTISDDTPYVLANNGELERMHRCERYATINFSHEFKSKTQSFAFIPSTCFDEFSACGTMKIDG